MTSNGVRVSCRVRGAELNIDSSPAVRAGSDGRSIVLTRRESAIAPDPTVMQSTPAGVKAESAYTFKFDAVFGPDATQEQLFESIARPLVREVVAGYNCTILAYGQTGSGKTYTTVGGSSAEFEGIVPRTFQLLLSRIKELSTAGDIDISLTASYVEIYQEKLRDLLLPLNSKRLRLREDKSRGVWIEGVSSINIDSIATGMALVARGVSHRSVGSTAMNADSSRSHSVLMLSLTKRRKTAQESTLASTMEHDSTGTMVIVDLAGSERAQKTDASGVRLEEAKCINQSLSTLGNVINALTESKVRHVPYRDSILTRLLQPSLGGNAKTHLLVTCSSREEHFEETLSTLRFGARAKRVTNSPRVNTVADDTIPNRVQRLLQTLRDKVESLGCYIQELEATSCVDCKARRQGCQPQHLLPIYCSTCGICEKDNDTNDIRSRSNYQLAEVGTTKPTFDGIKDGIIQVEMQSLQHALEVLEVSTQSQNRCEMAVITNERNLLRATVSELEAQIAQLKNDNQRFEALNHSLGLEVARQTQMVQKQDQGNTAEAEILRRHINSLELQIDALQMDAFAALQKQKEYCDLLTLKQRDYEKLHKDFELISATPEAGSSLPPKWTETRPLTADECLSPSWRRKNGISPDASGNHGSKTLSIQGWWSGEAVADPSNFELTDQNCNHRAYTNSSRENEYEPSRSAIPRSICNSSESVRPIRSRLVGLLASLEEETHAYRNLLPPKRSPLRDELIGKYNPLPAFSPRQRHRDLPAIEQLQNK